MPYTPLTSTERGQLHALCKDGKSQTHMADCLGRHRSTISRELRRNRASHGYDAPRAQRQCDQRREWCRPAQKQTRRMLWRYVTGKLMEGGLQKPSRSGCRWGFPTTQRCALAMRRFTVRSTWTNAGIISSNTCPGRAPNGVNAVKGKHRAAPVSPTVWALNSAPPSSKNAPVRATGKAVPSSARDSKAISLPSSLAPHVCSRAATWTRNMRTWSIKPSSTRSKRCPFPG